MGINNLDGNQPVLSFEFASLSCERRPLTFTDPLEIISAYRAEEVLPCLERVQKAVHNGLYAAGFLSYESAPAFNRGLQVKEGHKMPLLWFGLFSEPVEKSLTSSSSFTLSDWIPDAGEEEYRQSIELIKRKIAEGMVQQVNFTIRLNARFAGDAIALFEQMKEAQSSNYCAYANIGGYTVLSASPELFFHLKGDTIIMKPMKGTIQRGKTFEEDQEKASWLYHSEKNRMENRMVVDLMKNDLGKIAEVGSVYVQKLYEIEQYPTVHQMTSTITAKLPSSVQLIDIFKALFPSGSITGPPKTKGMELIAHLEKTPREVYCGAMGYISPKGEAVFNVPIRTVIIEEKTGKAAYGVGGGITVKSTAEDEYHEVMAKASFLKKENVQFQLLESILLDEGQYFLLEEHLERLRNSARYFQFPFHLDTVKDALNQFARQHKEGCLKVRLLLDKNDELTVEGEAISLDKARKKTTLAGCPVDEENIFLYHKTTNRQIYTKLRRSSPDLFDTLLFNRKGELTEFTNGNVVLEIDGKLWTPPVRSGLLAGTFRNKLIKEGVLKEKVLTKEDLQKCSQIWLINSVRKWVEVELISFINDFPHFNA